MKFKINHTQLFLQHIKPQPEQDRLSTSPVAPPVTVTFNPWANVIVFPNLCGCWVTFSVLLPNKHFSATFSLVCPSSPSSSSPFLPLGSCPALTGSAAPACCSKSVCVCMIIFYVGVCNPSAVAHTQQLPLWVQEMVSTYSVTQRRVHSWTWR